MKTLLLLLALTTLIQADNSCAKFECDGKISGNTCGIRKDDEVELTKCPNYDFCQEDPYYDKSYICNVPKMVPGTVVSDRHQCLSLKTVNQSGRAVCAGTALGGNCTSDADCGVNLYCTSKLKICHAVAKSGEKCDLVNGPLCGSSSFCVNGTCVLIGSLADGVNNPNFPMACQSNWVDPLSGNCSQGWSLTSANTVNNEGDTCHITYNGVDVTGTTNFTRFSFAQCLQRSDRKAVCSKGPKDTNNNFTKVANYVSTRKLSCHRSYAFSQLGLCNIYNDVNGYNQTYQAAMQVVFNNRLLNMPKCVQSGYNFQIQEYFNILNYNDNSGASSLPVSMLLILTLLFVIFLL